MLIDNIEFHESKHYPNYLFSKCGKVYSLFKNRLLIPFSKVYPFYSRIHLKVGNNHKCLYLHRVIAETFISNENNGTDVNHIDGNKLNNLIENLEWCTRKENMYHAKENGLLKFKEKLIETKEQRLMRLNENFKRFMVKNPERVKEIQSKSYFKRKHKKSV